MTAGSTPTTDERRGWRATATMECDECGTVVFMTLANSAFPFTNSRGRITLPRSITEHLCPVPSTDEQRGKK